VGTVNVLIVIFVAGTPVGAVIWNRLNSMHASRGVEFGVPAAPEIVIHTLENLYRPRGAVATTRRTLSGVRVSVAGADALRVDSRRGDVALIEVRPDGMAGSVVRARTTELHVGTPPTTRLRGGLAARASASVDGVYQALGISPNAARMKRFQRGIQDRLTRELRR
jgi:hypothetical protein